MCDRISEELICSMIQYNDVRYDYRHLFRSTALQDQIYDAYKKYRRSQCIEFCDIIEEHFSTLFYLHVVNGPISKESVNEIFVASSYEDLFQVPCYYDLSTYMKAFRMFVDRIFEKKYETHNNRVRSRRIKLRYKTSLIESLTLCK